MPTFYDRKQKSGAQISPHRSDSYASGIGTGPFIATVEKNADYRKKGSLEVSLEDNVSQNRSVESNRISVQVLMPFYSVKDYKDSGENPQKYDDTQQSAGMVFPAPRVGTKGLVLLIGGSINKGIWLGGIVEEEMNHQIPDYATRTDVAVTSDEFKAYGPPLKGLPTGNYNKKAQAGQVTPEKIKYPVHPLANVLKTQGLLNDTARGLTTSSMQRESVNSIFGVNTPGKYTGDKVITGADKNAKQVTQRGGHVFVMDDGDTEGKNNLIRLRTQGGHQILLNDSDDLIYIGNKRGTAWIELTSDGKMDVFAQDSISLRTEADFNFFADRDVNIEAKRNVNIKAGSFVRTESANLRNMAYNSMRTEVKGNYNLRSLNTLVDTGDLSLITNNFDVQNRYDTTITSGNIDLATINNTSISAGTSIDLKANTSASLTDTFVSTEAYSTGYTVTVEGKYYRAKTRTQSPQDLSLIPVDNGDYWEELSGPTNKIGTANGEIRLSTDGSNISVKTDKTVYVDGTEAVHLNLPGASSAIGANAASPSVAAHVRNLGVFTHTGKSSSADWAGYNYYTSGQFTSIMKRVPTHEPYDEHENSNPTVVNKVNNDIET